MTANVTDYTVRVCTVQEKIISVAREDKRYALARRFSRYAPSARLRWRIIRSALLRLPRGGTSQGTRPAQPSADRSTRPDGCAAKGEGRLITRPWQHHERGLRGAGSEKVSAAVRAATRLSGMQLHRRGRVDCRQRFSTAGRMPNDKGYITEEPCAGREQRSRTAR